MNAIGKNATRITAGDWTPEAADGGDEPERRREAVAGRDRSDADHDVRDERDRVLLEALVLDLNSA